jgi:hypothetical protein
MPAVVRRCRDLRECGAVQLALRESQISSRLLYRKRNLRKENTVHFLSIFRSHQHTSRPDSQRWFRKKSLGVLTAFVLSLGGTSGAEAQDAKTFPGSMCQASGSSQNLYYSSSVVANRAASTQSAVCPIVRDDVTRPGNGSPSVSEIGMTLKTLPVWRIVEAWTEQRYGHKTRAQQVKGFRP